MKKAFDQTLREIKREVNKKVLKVPGVEQKVLDATSNEPWGPHGSLLADIAQATRNYHEYQMIMQVIWKRINDTGKNWRHVYKGLTVLEYMIAHGSERVIDEIREHAHQISTLSDFQYIDSNGRDQGNNVRKKSQSLVVLVNDKERIQEVRQKAAANKDRFRNTSLSGMHRPGSGGYGYDDDRYSGRDDYRNGYGREKEWGDGRSYGRDGDNHGRSQSVDGYRYSPRSRSSDRERDRGYEDDGQYSSRGSGAKADDRSFSNKGIQRKYSEPNLAPPSYEDDVHEAPSPVHSERGGEILATPAPISSGPSQIIVTSGVSALPLSTSPPPQASLSPLDSAPSNKEIDSFDDFDPRGPFEVAPTTSSNAEVDLLGSLSDIFYSNPLAIVPVTPEITASEADTSAGTTFSTAPSASQPFDDPFGDGTFRAFTTTDTLPAQFQKFSPTSSFATQNVDTTDVLADILPLPSQTGFPPQQQPMSINGYYSAQTNFTSQPPLQNAFVAESGFTNQPGFVSSSTQQYNNSVFVPQNSFISNVPSQPSVPASNALALVPQPAKDTFETKSTVWADTLSRGLVNLNISGSKTNPLADIGVDFDAINRREKRMEKPTISSVTSTIIMGKAMGSGTSVGRAGAGALRPPINSGIGLGGGFGGGMNRPPTGMNMSMGQGGAPMQQAYGGYNPMMGRGGGYTHQQPYGGGFR